MKIEREFCPFCGTMVLGDPYKVKRHVVNRHKQRVKDFVSYFEVMVRRWMKT